jgi:hypothetical protein
MKWAAVLILLAVAAGCGGGGGKNEPEVALLTDVRTKGDSVTFEFRGEPQDVKARYVARRDLAECGSGAPVPLRGGAYAVIHFTPAQTASIADDGTVTPTYTGPRRLQGTGPVTEVAKLCDFEADVGWAIGVERRLPLDVSTDGGTVTIHFG